VTVFETAGHVALRLTLGAGEVTLEAAEDGRVEIELVSLRDNDATRQAIAEARVEMTDRPGGHEIVVQVPKKSSFLSGRGSRVGLRVHCPQGSDLILRGGSANLDAAGAIGAVDVRTASGDVSLEDVASLHVDTASGDIGVRDVDGSFNVRTASGDVTVRRCGGLLAANLVSGDLSVSEASAGLTVNTVSGDVRIHSAGGGGMRIQAVSGDVHLGIKPGERLFLDASSVSGTMSSELALADEPPADSTIPVIELRARTVSGDVEIVRAAVVSA
jgi:DUF4097 and DUF4098 domain-containing protein YvlB